MSLEQVAFLWDLVRPVLVCAWDVFTAAMIVTGVVSILVELRRLFRSGW